MHDWTELDIRVRTPDSDQRVARVCMTFQLYGGPEFARHVHDLCRAWLETFAPDTPLHFVSRSAVSPRPLTAKDQDRICAAVAQCRSRNEFFWINSAPGFELGTHSLELDLWPHNPNASSALVICRALETDLSPADAQQSFHAFSMLLDTPGLVHASAGLGMGVVWGSDFEQACGPKLYANCMRYRGLDLPNRGIYSRLLDRVKGPGWLSFVNRDLAPALAPVSDAPADYRELTTASGGRLLVAGELPPLGDVNRGARDLAAMRHAAKVLQPLRLTRWIDIPLPIEAFDLETDVWLARLDELLQ